MNANETLREYNCTEKYYRYIYDILITDGIKALADKFECYWLLDIIVSYQDKLEEEDFQVWSLVKYDDGSAIVNCTDGNHKQLVSQVIDHTDFKATSATLWLENDVILLPSEH